MKGEVRDICTAYRNFGEEGKTRRNIRKNRLGNKGTTGNITRNIIDKKRNARTIKDIVMNETKQTIDLRTRAKRTIKETSNKT